MNMPRIVKTCKLSGLSPEWLCELRQRKIVHDGNVNEFVGVVDDGQDGGEIV